MKKERNLIQDDEIIAKEGNSLICKGNARDRKIPHELKKLKAKWEISPKGKKISVGNLEIKL